MSESGTERNERLGYMFIVCNLLSVLIPISVIFSSSVTSVIVATETDNQQIQIFLYINFAIPVLILFFMICAWTLKEDLSQNPIYKPMSLLSLLTFLFYVGWQIYGLILTYVIIPNLVSSNYYYKFTMNSGFYSSVILLFTGSYYALSVKQL